MPSQIDFNTIVEGIQSAVVTAQHLVENQHLDELTGKFFFNDNGVPISQEVRVPSMREPGKYEVIDVPLFSVVPHSSIRIKELKVKFKTRLASVIEGDDQGQGREKRTRLGCSLGGGSRWWPFGGKKTEADDTCEVEIVFSATDPPEALAKINDEMVKRITPLPEEPPLERRRAAVDAAPHP